jgi:hypothetical protein
MGREDIETANQAKYAKKEGTNNLPREDASFLELRRRIMYHRRGDEAHSSSASSLPNPFQGSLQGTIFFLGAHLTMPKREFVLQVAQAGIDTSGRGTVSEPGVLGHSLQDLSPSQELGYSDKGFRQRSRKRLR